MNRENESSKSYSTWEIIRKTALAADISFSKYFAFSATAGPYRPMMKVLELSCHGIPWIMLCLYALYQTTDEVFEEVVFNLLLALFMDLIIVGFLKVLFRRKRPSYNKGDMFATISVDNYSFPSGHATRAYMVTWFILYHVKFAFPVRVLILIWCHCVGISRVILGRHHISDVAAGFLVGYWEFLLIENYWMKHESCSYILQYVK